MQRRSGCVGVWAGERKEKKKNGRKKGYNFFFMANEEIGVGCFFFLVMTLVTAVGFLARNYD
jgi:hypothetical protein